MAANSANVLLRLLSNGGVDRPLTYEELDANFQELVKIIDDHQAYARQHQLNGTTTPTVNDDETAGYEVRSLWFDTSGTETEIFQCADATTGAAEWVKTSFNYNEQNASDTDYDNTVSGLTATNVQDAVDEVDNDLDTHVADLADPHDAQAFQVDYDNTSSGLNAVDTQDAIDEVQSNLDSHEAATDPHSQYTTDQEATVIAQDQAVVFSIALG